MDGKKREQNRPFRKCEKRMNCYSQFLFTRNENKQQQQWKKRNENKEERKRK